MPKPVIFYQVQVHSNEKSWIVEHRYSEFDDLLNSLKKTFTDLPPLPPKTAFKLKSEGGILIRKQGLDKFIKELIKRPEVLNHTLVCDFLKVEFVVIGMVRNKLM